jgi:lactoylglutathione lyase
LSVRHTDTQTAGIRLKIRSYDDIGFLNTPTDFRNPALTCLVRDGQAKQLHIIEGATSRTDQPKRNHTCFRIASLQDFVTRLTKAGIAYEDLQGTPGAITLRPDGIQQVYFRDPDGYWIEMN